MSKELELARELLKRLQEKEDEEKKIQLSELKAGDVFKIGEHDFIVLKQLCGLTGVISKNLMLKSVKFDDNTRDYNRSNLKKVIEKEIQPIIEKAVGADNIVEHVADLTSVDMQNEFGTCRCKVRPLTFDEARECNDLLVNKEIGDWWWTCTPWSTEERGRKYPIAVVSPSGIVDINYDNGDGVRPFCILKSNIFVSKGE
ncbi:MAG: hypothetical protein E7293_03250 [Lachnospiraceae bacterium]|nr:hypothetical protein [Lachnospiraceae bacterium]